MKRASLSAVTAGRRRWRVGAGRQSEKRASPRQNLGACIGLVNVAALNVVPLFEYVPSLLLDVGI